MKKIFIIVVSLFITSTPLWASTATPLKTPNISANALFLYRHSNFENEDLSTTRNGLDLEEVELAFYSDVDPYTTLNVLLTIHPEYELDGAGTSVEESFVLEPEELFVTSNIIPSVTLKLGKFKAFFGKHNYLHSHVFPFIDAPVVNENLVGEEGLNDVGASAAILLPTDWYSELTLQYLRGEGENSEFNSSSPNDGVGVAHFKNLWDLTDSLTTEFGQSYAVGNNSLGGKTTLLGADLTFKYRPVVGGKYHSLIFAGEYIHRNLEQQTTVDEVSKGWNVWSKYQFAQRWSLLARYDYFKSEGGNSAVNDNALDLGITKKYALAMVFQATEFSKFQFEANVTNAPINSNGKSSEKRIYLQANFTIGAHPAHSY